MKKILLLMSIFPMSLFAQPFYKGDSLSVNVSASVIVLEGNALKELLNTLPKHYPNPRVAVQNVEGRIFRYNYFVQNNKSSPKSMESFEIHILDAYGANHFTIPRTIDPNHWEFPDMGGSLYGYSYVNWVVDRDTTDIFDMDISTPGKWGLQPGGTISFGFLSKQPPGIGKFQATTFIRPTSVDEDDSLQKLGYTNKQISPPPYNLGYQGLTLTPKSPTSPFDGISWIDTLISYKHQSVTLGWLTNGSVHEKDEDGDKSDEGIVERLDRRLDKAKAALAKSDSVKARLELELFVKEVEDVYHQNKEEGKRLGVPVLTSEGYALLKYNAEYLIDRLPERSRR
jgi:hypothetical protein